MTVSLDDPLEGYWTLERSADLAHWEAIKTKRTREGAWAYQHAGREFAPSLYYRLVNANTVERVLKESIPKLYGNLLPEHFTVREQHVLVSSSSGGWAGDGGVIERVVTVQEPVPEWPELFDRNRDQKATLGRVLFYDKRLSANNSLSCASCHQQKFAFADNRPLSRGIHGQETARNSMPLANLIFTPTDDRFKKGAFFWDLREATLRETVLRPIENPVEMGMPLDKLPNKLSGEPYYASLFEGAFGDPEVTIDRIGEGLEAFLKVMVSYRSKFDRAFKIGMRHFTEEERLGRALFVGKAGCAQCHTLPFFDASFPTNNGLDLISDKDPGLAGHTEKAFDNGFFKTPTLRNIELTAPYMHDGRFESLKEVVDFYNEGIQPHDQLDPILRASDGTTRNWTDISRSERQAVRLDLSMEEREALVAFMKTLTDRPLINDDRLSDPFKQP